jgi:hypothetical protein
MRYLLAPLALAVLVAACGGNSATPGPLEEPFGTPPPLLALPANLSGIPGPAAITSEVAPVTPDSELAVGRSSNFTLGHCGLASPVDIDGSLWNPVGYRTVSGAPMTEAQEGELINATSVAVTLVNEDTLEIDTDSGLTVELSRHDGPRRYVLCD